MNQVPDHRIVQLVGIDHLALQQAALGPAHLPTALLVDEEPLAQAVRVDLEEAGQLPQVHGGVELEVGLDGRGEHVCFDLGHEDAQVVLDGVDVDAGVVEVGRRGRDELGAGGAKELLEQR